MTRDDPLIVLHVLVVNNYAVWLGSYYCCAQVFGQLIHVFSHAGTRGQQQPDFCTTSVDFQVPREAVPCALPALCSGAVVTLVYHMYV